MFIEFLFLARQMTVCLPGSPMLHMTPSQPRFHKANKLSESATPAKTPKCKKAPAAKTILDFNPLAQGGK